VYLHPPPDPPPAPPPAGPSSGAANAEGAASNADADGDEFHDAAEAVSDEDSAKSALADKLETLSVAATSGSSDKADGGGSGGGSGGAAAKEKEKRPDQVRYAVIVPKDPADLTARRLLTRLTELNAPPPPLDRSNLSLATEWGQPGLYLFWVSKFQACLAPG
jgi:hypothetical protein